MPADIFYQISVWILPVALSIALHEAAHGYAAWRLGDDTAKKLGRVTLNPFAHIDVMGSIILPALLIFSKAGILLAWAKPVPVNFARLRKPKRDMIWVAAAGPFSNFILAFLTLLVMALFYEGLSDWGQDNLQNFLQLNLVLIAFNLLPIPPLDGFKILVGILPNPLAERVFRLERYGMMIVLGVIFLLPWVLSSVFGYPVDILGQIIREIMGILLKILLIPFQNML